MEGIRISRDGEEFGPYDLESLCGYVVEGQVLLDDHAWAEGMDDWTSVAQLLDSQGLEVEVVAEEDSVPQPPPPPSQPAEEGAAPPPLPPGGSGGRLIAGSAARKVSAAAPRLEAPPVKRGFGMEIILLLLALAGAIFFVARFAKLQGAQKDLATLGKEVPGKVTGFKIKTGRGPTDIKVEYRLNFTSPPVVRDFTVSADYFVDHVDPLGGNHREVIVKYLPANPREAFLVGSPPNYIINLIYAGTCFFAGIVIIVVSLVMRAIAKK